jgi:hypothetical protein
MRTKQLVATLAALGCVSAPTISQSPQRLIGLTSATPLVITQDMGNCAVAQCPPFGFPPVAVPFAGGTAHDGITRGTWISDGFLIAKVDARNQCTFQCPPMPMPNTAPGNEVTGLAFNEITKTLWVTDRSGIIRWYNAAGCPLTLVSRCIPPIPAGAVLTGCATDDVGDLLFYSIVIPGTPGGIVYVARQTAPCQPFCRIPLNQCLLGPLSPLTGLAFDSCKQTLWATDGKLTVGGVYALSPTGACTFSEVQCCINTSGEPLAGLCILPSTERPLGPNCTRPPCPACPNMQHVLGGEPIVGNPAFSLDLINAPNNSNAYLVFNVGPCTAPGTPIGIFCAPLLVPLVPPPLVGGPFATGAGAGCTGGVVFNLPVPANIAICGAVFSSQYIGLCPGAALPGTFVSNCISFMVTAS